MESSTRDEIKDVIQRHGGSITGNVSSRTSYAVVGADARPSKLKKIARHKTKVLTEDELFALVLSSEAKPYQYLSREQSEENFALFIARCSEVSIRRSNSTRRKEVRKSRRSAAHHVCPSPPRSQRRRSRGRVANGPLQRRAARALDYTDMLDRILEWAETNPQFDASTCEGINDYYSDHYDFTSFQEDAIENVYYKWKIDKWYDKKYN